MLRLINWLDNPLNNNNNYNNNISNNNNNNDNYYYFSNNSNDNINSIIIKFIIYFLNGFSMNLPRNLEFDVLEGSN